MRQAKARNRFQLQPLSCEHSAMPRYDAVVSVDQHRIAETEFLNAASDLCHLSLAVRACVAGVGNQVSGRDVLDDDGGLSPLPFFFWPLFALTLFQENGTSLIVGHTESPGSTLAKNLDRHLIGACVRNGDVRPECIIC